MEELKLTHALADVIPFAYGLDHLTKHPDLLAEALALDWEDPRLPVWMAGWLSRAFLRAHQVHDEELPLQALRLTGVAVAWASWKLEAIAFWGGCFEGACPGPEGGEGPPSRVEGGWPSPCPPGPGWPAWFPG